MRSSEHRAARLIVASVGLALGCAAHRSGPPPPPPSDAGTGQVATASWYGPGFHGRRTASGERFDANAMSAAHPSLPFGTRLCVTNLANGRSVRVRVNDRGPYGPGRSLDVSYGAARVLGIVARGTARVRIDAEHACREREPSLTQAAAGDFSRANRRERKRARRRNVHCCSGSSRTSRAPSG